MFSQYIKIAVANILSEHNNGIERCCGSCNPSCDDLTRFICFGHTMAEINEWLNAHPEQLNAQIEKDEAKLYEEYSLYMQSQQDEEKLSYAKTFCTSCPKYLECKEKALNENNSVFDAVADVEHFQRNCLKSCVKFQEAFLLHMMEAKTDAEDFDVCM